jgi:dolichyl-phosphate-mannose-protein mannosyltransferase
VRHVWTFLWIRVAFWLAAAATLLWVPPDAEDRAVDRAWGPISDLLFGTFDHWDAQWYIHVARDGYNATSAAFWPLYPLLLHLLGSSIVLGTLLSLVAGGFAAWAIAELARPLLGEDGAHDSVLLLALFPTAFVFTAMYSDGLFLALSAWSFLAAIRGQSWRAGILGGLAVATRLLGLALLPALVWLLWRQPRKLVPLLCLPLAVVLYGWYLQRHVGDFWAFSKAQVFWERKTATLGPIGGLWDAIQSGGHSGLRLLRHLPRGQALTPEDRLAFWNVIHLALLVPAGWLTWVAWKRLGPAFGIYSLATLLIVLSAPSEGFPLVSLPRFLMADFPILLAIAALIRDRPAWRTGVLVAFGALSALAGAAFSHGIWVA